MDEDGLSSGVGLLLVGIAVVVLDLRINDFDLLFDPVGQVMVWVSLDRMLAATPPGASATAIRALAGLAVAVSVGVELVLLGGGEPGLVESLLYLLQTIGTLLLARHLRDVLDADRSLAWDRVVVASVVELPLVFLMAVPDLLGEAVALVLPAFVVVTVVAGALLLVALVRTRAQAGGAIGP